MATIKDVAREAGVSVATVSRVFNDSALVSETTRSQVRDVAKKLNYWPNGVARSLITNRTHAIGVLLPELFGEFFSEVLRGMDRAARGAGLHLLVSSSHAHTDELIDAVRTMRGRIDGLVVMAPDVDARAAVQAAAQDFPMVLVNPGSGVERCDAISVANYEGAQAVVKHLRGLGHQRIAIITGPAGNVDAQQRLEGYRAALRKATTQHARDLEIPGDFTEASGYDAALRLLALDPKPTAVFAANDYMAIGLMGALNDAGLQVPEDFAVVGFDDIPMARYLNPPLTTVHVDAFKLGERAVEQLVSIDRSGRGGGKRRHEVLPTTLVVRASCSSASSSRREAGGGAGAGRRRPARPRP